MIIPFSNRVENTWELSRLERSLAEHHTANLSDGARELYFEMVSRRAQQDSPVMSGPRLSFYDHGYDFIEELSHAGLVYWQSQNVWILPFLDRPLDGVWHLCYKTVFSNLFALSSETDQTERLFYVGVHSTKDLRDGYQGSGAIVKPLLDLHQAETEILSIHLTRRIAEISESKLIAEAKQSPSNLNISDGVKV